MCYIILYLWMSVCGRCVFINEDLTVNSVTRGAGLISKHTLPHTHHGQVGRKQVCERQGAKHNKPITPSSLFSLDWHSRIHSEHLNPFIRCLFPLHSHNFSYVAVHRNLLLIVFVNIEQCGMSDTPSNGYVQQRTMVWNVHFVLILFLNSTVGLWPEKENSHFNHFIL